MAKQPLPDISAKSSAADRLGQALTLLTQRKSNLDEPQQATVAELCRLAGVSRNSLYRYHSETLKALRKFQCRRPTRQDFSATRTSNCCARKTLRCTRKWLNSRDWSITTTPPIERPSRFSSAAIASWPPCAGDSI